jgi:hypothetical protein
LLDSTSNCTIVAAADALVALLSDGIDAFSLTVPLLTFVHIIPDTSLAQATLFDLLREHSSLTSKSSQTEVCTEHMSIFPIKEESGTTAA